MDATTAYRYSGCDLKIAPLKNMIVVVEGPVQAGGLGPVKACELARF